LNGREGKQPLTVNLETEHGYSVLDMVRTFEKASGRAVLYQIVDRRPGDIATYYADPALAERLFGWEAQFGIEKMCEDTQRWPEGNPEGYV
jgi:UDP-glucose 4-epimerase